MNTNVERVGPVEVQFQSNYKITCIDNMKQCEVCDTDTKVCKKYVKVDDSDSLMGVAILVGLFFIFIAFILCNH